MSDPRLLAGLALLASIQGATASDFDRPTLPRFYLNVGAAGLFYDEGAKMALLGTPVPGARVGIKDVATVAIEAGYFLTPNIAASLTAGYPPLSKVTGAGSVQSLGTLGKTVGGPVGASIHYHFDGLGPFRPYIGGGVAGLVGFDEKDGAMQRLKVKNTLGPMLQAGVDYMLSERWGLFVDVKKSFLSTVATGSVGGVPAKARVTIDPLVVHSGVTFRW